MCIEDFKISGSLPQALFDKNERKGRDERERENLNDQNHFGNTFKLANSILPKNKNSKFYLSYLSHNNQQLYALNLSKPTKTSSMVHQYIHIRL